MDTMTASGAQGDHADLARLVRHLSAGLSLWRLYPGQSQRSDVGTAIEMTQDAARSVLGTGAVRLDVRPDGLSVDDDPLPPSVHNERLARALYDRRVSHLDLLDAPSAAEVESLLDVITRPAGELDDVGGAGHVLEAAGVEAVVLWTGEPEPLLALRVEVEELHPRERRAAKEDRSLGFEGVSTGADLFSRLTELARSMPEGEAELADFYLRAQEAAAELPMEERAEFGRQVLRNAVSDGFAERYLGQLTDPRLAELAVEVAIAEGADPEELATEIVTQAGRHTAVVRLVSAAIRRQQDEDDGGSAPRTQSGPLGDAPVEDPQLAAATVALHHSVLRGASTEVGPQGGGGAPVLDTAAPMTPEVRALRGEYPSTGAQVRQISLDALQDYLALDDDLPRLTQSATALAGRLRDACAELDEEQLSLLVDTVERALVALPSETAELVIASCNAVVDQSLATLLADKVIGGTELSDVVAVLEPMGAQAVEAVLQALANEDRAAYRRVHVSLLGALAEPHIDVLILWLQDPRWFVVRNVATALGQVGGTAAIDPLLQLGAHEDERVRREASRSLIAAVGNRGVAELAARARTGSEETYELVVTTLGTLPALEAAHAIVDLLPAAPSKAAARHALEALAGHDDAQVPALLGEVASGRRGAGIGWFARRRARRLARTRGGAA
jgi:hypothetical protein